LVRCSPAKNDGAVWLMYRSAYIAGKHRSHREFAVLVGAGLAREERLRGRPETPRRLIRG